MADFFSSTSQGYILKLHIVPGARQTMVAGLHGDRLKIKVAAAPEKGRANQELLEFLAHTLKVPLKDVRLTSGTTSRAKAVAVLDTSPDLESRLLALLSKS